MLILNSPIFRLRSTPQEYNNYEKRFWPNRVPYQAVRRMLDSQLVLVAPYTSGSLPALDAESADWAGSAPDREAESGSPDGSGFLQFLMALSLCGIAACEPQRPDSLAELLAFSEDGGQKELRVAIAKALAVDAALSVRLHDA